MQSQLPNRRTLLVVAVAATLLVFLVVVSAVLTMVRAGRRTVEAVTKPKEEVVDLTTVVTRVRDLNRLETATMRVVHVGTIRQSYQYVPNALGGDEITLMATGDVIAGIDLARLQPGDVERQSDGAVIMRLPPAQILVTRVDNRETRVIARKTGLVRRPDRDLETRARQHAEAMIRSEALKKGVVNLARDNAEKKIAALLHSIGVQNVRFVRPGEVVPRMPGG